ncbi:protein of unknown function [Pararobbsia alpina]
MVSVHAQCGIDKNKYFALTDAGGGFGGNERGRGKRRWRGSVYTPIRPVFGFGASCDALSTDQFCEFRPGS